MKKKEESLTLADIKANPLNPREHTPRNIGMIVDSIQEFGFLEPIQIDEDNQIIHGHGRQDAAAEVGIENVRVIETDGNEVIAIRRRGLTPKQKLMAAIALNRSAELAGWDRDVLVAFKNDGFDLGAYWTDKEFAKIPDMATPEPGSFGGEMSTDVESGGVKKTVEFTAEQWETVGAFLDRYRASHEGLLSDGDILTEMCAEAIGDALKVVDF